MTLLGKDASLNLTELQAGLNRLFDQLWHSGLQTGPLDGQDWSPPIDVIEKPDCYVVLADMAGVSLEDLEVTGQHHQITLKGQKLHRTKEPQDSPIFSERRYGSFCRIIPMTNAIQVDAIIARLNGGVLELVCPKKTTPAGTPVQIKIQVTDSR